MPHDCSVDVPEEGTALSEPSAPAGRRRLLGCAALTGGLLLLDQLTKLVIVQNYHLHESTPVIPDIFSITYVRNIGAAWGIFSGQIWLLLLIAVVMTAAMIRFYDYLTERYLEREIALFVIFSGILGNSIDRICRRTRDWRRFPPVRWGAKACRMRTCFLPRAEAAKPQAYPCTS